MNLAKQRKPSAATPYRMLSAAQLSYLRGDTATAATQAMQVLQQIPYQRGACNLAVKSLRQEGSATEAETISKRCRSYFPSRHLL